MSEDKIISQFSMEWSLDNWGEDLIACPKGGAIYTWEQCENGKVSNGNGDSPAPDNSKN